MRKLYVLLMALFVGFMANSQVSTYTFNQAAGTYSSVSGGTVLGTTSNDEEVFNNSTAGGSAPVTATGFPIGFTFTYRGVSFDKFAVATNGYIVLGTGSFSIANTTTTAISTSTTSGFTNLISGFNQDLQGQTGSELSYQLTGSSPNRVLVVQWKNYKRYNGTGTMNYNFQIRLSEGTNTIDFVYGAMTTVTSYTAQVGLRGTSNTDYNTRTTTTNWLATTLGSAATSTITLSASVYPVSGTTYTFTPTAIPPCTAPTTQATAFVPGTATSSTAPGSFTAASGTPSGYLVVRSVGTFMGMPVDGTTYVAGNTIGNGTVVQSSAATTFTASTLTGNTNYTFTLLSYNTGSCSGGPKYYTTSPLTGNATTCPATPSSLSVTNLTTNGGRINWASSGGGGASAITYTLDVTTDAAFASPISGSPFTVSDATAVANVVSYDVSGLNAATTYYYRIKASGCNTVTASSSFVTSCAAISAFPYTQGFETTGLPGCWTSSEGAPGASYHWTTTAADATYGVAGPQSGSRFAFLYVFLAQVTYNPYYLNSPSFVLDATPRQIAYYYYLGTGGYKGTTGATGADPYPLELQITTDNGATWTSIYSHSTTNSTFATTTAVSNWKLTTVDLSTYVGQTVAFRFKSNSNYGSGILDQGVDNFSIDIVPTCAAPVPGSATGITTTSATLNWAAPTATPASYEIYYSTSSTPPTGSTVPTTTGITTTSQALTGLTAATTYYVWVRSNCGRGLVSDWSGSAITFTTACGILNVPYVQDFNSVTVPALPSCTVVENTNADANTWKTIPAGSTTAITSIALDYAYNSAAAANDWFFTPKLNLNSGTSYTLRFKYLASSTTYPEKLKVVTGTDQTSVSMTGATLFNATGISNTSYKDTSIIFTVPSTGVYVFGFQVYSDADEDNLVIDDISIDVTPLCAAPATPIVSNLLSTSSTVTWSGTGSYILEYGVSSFTPATGATAGTGGTVVNPATSPVNITGLTPATGYDLYVRQNCTGSGNGYSPNTKVSFTTPGFDNDNASGAVTLTHIMYNAACTGTVYSTVGATASPETSTCFSSSQDDDVWFKFVATDTKAILKLSNYSIASGTPGTFYYGVYTGAPGSLAEVNCDLSSVVSTTNGGGEIYIPAVLNVGTTYYIRALTGGTGGRATFNLCVMSPDVSANTTANTCVAAQTFDISGGLTTLWVPLFMADGKLVGEINANGNTLGSTTVKVYRNTNAVRKDFYNKSYLDRNIEITPTTQPTSGTVSVRLYFTNAELTALQNDPGSQVTSSSDLGVFKNSQSCAVTVGAGAAPVAGATTTSYGSNYYIGFDVSSFSTFYVASKNFASLPANILTFSGLRQGAANNLKWTVAQETDVQVYGIERSEDGNRWSTVGTVNSLGNTTQQRSYTFSDNNISGLKQLYRLRQTDRNGSVKISNTIVINGTKATLLTLSGLFPNPASGKVNLLVDAPVKDNITIVVMDAVGRIVKTQKAAVDAGSNTLEVNVASLAGGSYMIKLTCDSNCQSAVSKFVKE